MARLSWDEGPDCGGPHGPYRQSDRKHLYGPYAEQLIAQGDAFRCFCTSERLNEMRAEQMKAGQTARYDGHCISLSEEELKSRLDEKAPHVVRMKVPSEGTCTVKDRLRGDIEIDWSQVDMQVLMKTDGNPTYHLAVVVDDHLMEISHIIRGEEWINSAPKHILLYQYFNWTMPELVHMPLLRNPDKSKLSKRKNPTSINFYKDMGFLPEAVVNYLGMLGWSMPDGEEKFSLDQMIEQFDLERISLGAPVFDMEKLKWLNGRWLRENLSDEQLADKLIEWSFNRETLLKVIPLIKERVDVFSEVAPMSTFLFDGMLPLDENSFDGVKKLEPDQLKLVLQFSLWRLEAQRDWSAESLNQLFIELAEQLEYKIRDVLAPMFIAISGKSVSPPLFDSMSLLGADMTRARVRHALNAIGGVSKKQLKKLDKQYAALAK